MAAKILCYPDSNDTWTFMNKGSRCDCGSNCFHYKSVDGVIGAYCNACESLIGFPLEEKEEELRKGHWKEELSSEEIAKEIVLTKLHTFAVIEKSRLEKDVRKGHISKAQAEDFLTDYIWKSLYPERDKADEKVLDFIEKISSYHQDTQKQDAVCELFSSGYCYYFAMILKEAFERGEVCWCAPYGHICWVDDNGHPYDIYGTCDSECTYYIPVSYIKKGLADFKHIPGESFDASEEYIQDAIDDFKRDLRDSVKCNFSWDNKSWKIEKKVYNTIQEMKEIWNDSDFTTTLNERYSLQVEYVTMTDGQTIQTALSLLCNEEERYLITAVSDYSDKEKLKENIHLLMQYMEEEPESVWASISSVNVCYYFKRAKDSFQFECNSPDLDEHYITILITSDKVGNEEVLAFGLGFGLDEESHEKKLLPAKDVSEESVAKMLLDMRHAGIQKLKEH